MKKIALILVLMLVFTSLSALADAAAPEIPAHQAYAGRWVDPVYDRAMLRLVGPSIDPDDESVLFDAQIRWGSSADSEGVWQMTARYDEATGALAYEGGSLTYVTYDADGAVAAEEVQWDDAEGAFTLTAEGTLLWQDSREERAAEFNMERVVSEAPSAEDFVENYFKPVADVEIGTAGASLKQAAVACGVVRFACESDLWNTDIDDMREAMLAGGESLDADTQARFDGNLFGGVIGELANGIYWDYDNLAGQFADAGVGEDAAFLNADPEASASWAILFAHTLTMGNSDD